MVSVVTNAMRPRPHETMVSVVTNVMRCKCASFHHNFIYLGWIILLILLGSRSTVPPPAAIPEPTSPSSVELREDNTIKFKGFNDDQIPPNTVVDVNIGTNYSPFGTQDDRYRILVDPLFGVCDSNAKLMNNVTAFCFAVSNYTGFATFNEYNERNGESSSLSEVAVGTSHEKFPILSKRTVLVLEAVVLFTAIHRANTQIHRLKLDMQGHELTTLKNIKSLLRVSNLVVHVKSECFCPNKNGLQIYQIDNSCENISVVLQDAGYATKWECSASEWSDVIAYKKGVGTDFLPVEDFN